MGNWIYPVIFFVKIFEVALTTIRVILVTKGHKFWGALMSIVDVTLWLILMSTVITNIQDDPLQTIVYIVAFAIGTYCGATIEDFLALGHSTIHVIATDEDGQTLANVFRETGFGVTTLPAHGKDDTKRVLLLHVTRKRLKDATRIINKTCPSAIITVNESKTLMNGYGLKK